MWRPITHLGPAIGALLVLLFTAATVRAEANVEPGDKVIVTAPQARLMLGERTVATARRGQEFEVLKVEGNWIGTSLEFAGKPGGGWIWFGQVAPADSAQAQRSIQRRFSFDPQAGGRRAAPAPAPRTERPAEPRTARQPSFMLPKSDPNRFR